jgi:leucyl-tRNA synthetase
VELIADTMWPKPDPELARDEQVRGAVQVNGKLRGTVELPRDAAARDAEEAALALPQVAKLLDGRKPRKVVVVPNRIVSVVA